MTSNLLASVLLAAADRTPDKVAVREESGTQHTYADLEALSARMAHVLIDLGLTPGDRVAVQVDKSYSLIALHLAVIRAGGVYLPLNSAYTDHEVCDLLDDAEPRLIVRDADLAHATRRVDMAQLTAWAAGMRAEFSDTDRSASDPASILYTSGTTGKPKGAVLSHGNLAANATTLVDAWRFTSDDVLLHILPLFHIHGLFVALHCTLASGSTLVLVERFAPETVVRWLPECTVLMGVPTHYVRLLAEPSFNRECTRNMRLFTSGSAPMLVPTHEEFRERTGQTILERYGMTETGMLTSNPYEGARKPGTVGPPLPGVQVRLDGGSPGVIEVTGPNVFSGYWRRPEVTAQEFTADGWFKTGDIGVIDADGYVEIVGRAKDVIITGGLNVYPKEIELAIDDLPGVLESAVIALPDPDFGEAVVAVVVPEAGAQLTAADIIATLRQRLAGFKVPKRVEIVDALPRNTMGKVEKAALRRTYGA